ncbi:c-type cytochrome [Brevundimonas sp. UBA2416]|uniref:c-type cytochrome n=1 Tax=Brevundimonas sp. UBA2416 TaxID=1946124 RepID=UPI0025C1EF46|nr:cytochrome c [Brevundimonas sp. UBA2416]
MFVLRSLAALALFCTGCGAIQPPVPTPASFAGDGPVQAAERGRRLADSACASCHATGPVGASPMAAAPPFRQVVHRYPLDRLEGAFAEGLVTSHPAMPAFNFRASEIDDLIAWLETVEAEP